MLRMLAVKDVAILRQSHRIAQKEIFHSVLSTGPVVVSAHQALAFAQPVYLCFDS
ncbi:hypothetical protein BgiBS90_012827, partial [Biomphalaria glabrata]